LWGKIFVDNPTEMYEKIIYYLENEEEYDYKLKNNLILDAEIALFWRRSWGAGTKDKPEGEAEEDDEEKKKKKKEKKEKKEKKKKDESDNEEEAGQK
jgi:hypothetical protein